MRKIHYIRVSGFQMHWHWEIIIREATSVSGKQFQSMAEIYGYVFHDGKKQAYYAEKAKKLKAAIEDKMTVW